MASEYTQNRRYPLYTDNDKPNLRDQYNGAIREIDADMADALHDSQAVAEALGSGFDAQHTVRMALDEKATSTALTTEISNREAADTALGTRIDNETSARTSADTALGTRIDNEVSTRQSADNALDGRLDTLESIIPSSAYTSSSTIKQALDSKANASSLASETTARQNADTTLGNNITTLSSRVDRLANRHVVVFGDSWSDSAVTDAVWVATLRNMTGWTIHNYAKNGCHTSDGSFASMYNAFINDNTYDKSTITDCILMYGVNDQFTYPVSASVARDAISAFYTAVIQQLPADVIIHYLHNHSYGLQQNTYEGQYNWFVGQVINLNLPRLVHHEMFSWFNASEYNSANWFHLTQTAQRQHVAKNIYDILTGGEILRLPTVYSGHDDFNFGANIDSSGILTYTLRVPPHSETINTNVVTSYPFPQKTPVYIRKPLYLPSGNLGICSYALTSAGEDNNVLKRLYVICDAAANNDYYFSDTYTVNPLTTN